MLKFDDLVNNLDQNKDKIEDYFLKFFTRSDFRQYEVEGEDRRAHV